MARPLLAVIGTVLGMLAFGAAPATAAAGPSVSKVSPGAGSTGGGTKVTVTGHNFTHVHLVTFGSAAARALHIVSSTTLTVSAPKHSAGTVSVRVHARAGTSAKVHAAQFTYTTKGAIAGTVTAKSGGRKLSHVDVDVFTPTGHFVTDVDTRSDGSYRIGGLRGSHSYDVCFDADGVTAGSATGYADKCYRHTAWDGPPASVPPVAVEVRVAAGRTTGRINVALATGGGISGTVISADDGTPLRQVRVSVVNPGSESIVSSTRTDHNGQYTLLGLRRGSKGSDVCFDGSLGKGGPSAAGYLDQCYDSTAWDGNPFHLPDDATLVPPSTGSPTPNINAALDASATISGTVTAASDSAPLSFVNVEVFRDDGSPAVDPVGTDADGHFRVAGLGTGVYNLCFAASPSTGGPSAGGYVAECYDDQFWDGDTEDIPGTAEAVSVTAGEPTTGKDAKLASGGGIAGRVTKNGGAPLTSVGVSLFAVNNVLAFTNTDSNGDYAFLGLIPASGAYEVCFDGSSAVDSNGVSVPDIQDECYNQAAWEGSGGPPDGANAVDVGQGDVTPDIDAVLSQV